MENILNRPAWEELYNNLHKSEGLAQELAPIESNIAPVQASGGLQFKQIFWGVVITGATCFLIYKLVQLQAKMRLEQENKPKSPHD